MVLHKWITSSSQNLVVDVIYNKVEVGKAELITDYVLVSDEV